MFSTPPRVSGQQYDISAHFVDSDIVFNSEYFRYKKTHPGCSVKDAILFSNQKMMEEIAADTGQAKEGGQLASFSLRQTPLDDRFVTSKMFAGLFCQALSSFHEELQQQTQGRCQLDKYLTGDTYAKKAAGTCFDEVLHYDPSVDLENISATAAIFDPTKIATLYARMHRLATLNPGKEIHITIWEGSSRVAKDLYDFLADNRDLIPQRVTLDFARGSNMAALKGRGETNLSYETVLQQFSEIYAGIGRKAENLSRQHIFDLLKVGVLQSKGENEQAALLLMAVKEMAGVVPEEETSIIPIEVKSEQDGQTSGYKTVIEVESEHRTRDASVTKTSLKPTEVEAQPKKPKQAMSLEDEIKADFNTSIVPAVLVKRLLDNIQEAGTYQKVRDIITILCKPEYCDRLKSSKWNVVHFHWKGLVIPITLSDLIVVAKCRILELRSATKTPLSPEDHAFLNEPRCLPRLFGKSKSMSLFGQLNQSKRSKEKACQQIKKRSKQHAEAIRRRH